jgi:hypothetical protein
LERIHRHRAQDRHAETGTAALAAADAELGLLPTITLRRILSSFATTL